MDYLFEIRTIAENSNFSIDDCILCDWRFSWHNNTITSFIKGDSSVRNKKDISSSFDYLETPNKLGFLVDVLSFCTVLSISCKMDYQLYEAKPQEKIYLLDKNLTWPQLSEKVRSLKLIEHGDSSDDWPVRINPNVSYTLKKEQLDFIRFLLTSFSKIKIGNNSIKLLNYWRRGFDLDQLDYWDESFLVFFKILEYFEKIYRPKKDKSLDKGIKLLTNKTERRAFRMAGGAMVLKPSKYLIRLLSDCIEVRNRFDIAHMRIKPLPKNREGSLYFTYYFNIWDLHDHIKEITRLVLVHDEWWNTLGKDWMI